MLNFMLVISADRDIGFCGRGSDSRAHMCVYVGLSVPVLRLIRLRLTEPRLTVISLSTGGRGPTLMDINYRLQHMRVSGCGGPAGCVPRRHSYDSAPRPDLSCGPPADSGATTLLEPRRDSGATVSTYYGSWSSQQPSRRESQMSQMSAAGGPGSLYDPISTDVSRRCSDMSAASAAPAGRLSAGMAAQLQRLQRRSLVSQQMGSMGNLVVQVRTRNRSSEHRQTGDRAV